MVISEKHVLTDKEVRMKVIITQNNETPDILVEIHCMENDENVKKLENYISNYDACLCGSYDGETLYICVKDILYFETVDNMTFIYTEDKMLTSKMRLYEIEEKLCDRDFFRCSKSVIVNLRKIRKLKPELTRSIMATLCNGEIIVISRRYAGALKKLIGVEK